MEAISESPAVWYMMAICGTNLIRQRQIKAGSITTDRRLLKPNLLRLAVAKNA
jgi:hypothetical protein